MAGSSKLSRRTVVSCCAEAGSNGGCGSGRCRRGVLPAPSCGMGGNIADGAWCLPPLRGIRARFRASVAVCIAAARGGGYIEGMPKSMRKRLGVAGLLLMCALSGTWGQVATWDDDLQAHWAAALDHLNMTTNAPAFDRDVAEPLLVLPVARRVLEDPLRVMTLGDEVVYASDTYGLSGLMAHAGRWLSLDATQESGAVNTEVATIGAVERLDALPDFLTNFLGAVRAAEALRLHAFQAVAPTDALHVACSLLGGIYNAEDDAAVREVMARAGFATNLIQRVIAEGQVLDPEPGARYTVDVIRSVDSEALLSGALLLEAASRRLAEAVGPWPDKPRRIETDLGPAWIGSPGDDVYDESAVLILEPGGNDRYYGSAGVAHGLDATPVAVIVDMGGHDTYEAEGLLGAGTALFGYALLYDLAGDDRYAAAYCGQGAGLFGIALLEDGGAGCDDYRAQAMSQGAAYAGLGLLRDGGGNDRYDVGFYGQGMGGVRGCGLLVDRAGDDRYHAGRVRHDYDRHDDRYLSLAQGFSIGMRPFAGGGVGILLDHSGHDSYEADVYGQGASYWYSLGMLLDVSGEDVYTIYHYGQGSGIHLSTGLLADGGGDDRYTGFALSQGNAHDYAVGILADASGNDSYDADTYAQARAMNNAFALLLDRSGDDSYAARRVESSQGIGHDGDLREYGSLAVLMDLAGHDRYSCGATNGHALLRPNFGVIYDVGTRNDK